MTRTKLFVGSVMVAAGLLVTGAPLQGQVGPSLGVVDANTVSEADLLKMPHKIGRAHV